MFYIVNRSWQNTICSKQAFEFYNFFAVASVHQSRPYVDSGRYSAYNLSPESTARLQRDTETRNINVQQQQQRPPRRPWEIGHPYLDRSSSIKRVNNNFGPETRRIMEERGYLPQNSRGGGGNVHYY